MTVGAVYLWTFHLPYPTAQELKKANTIICLAAGLKGDGSLGRFTEQRTRSCVDLYHQGIAPVVAFTGGNSAKGQPPTGEQMARLARRLGVPVEAIVVEGQSESTLQNALFTLPLLRSPRGIVLVTDSFHLPRSAASFYWAGARDIQLFPAYGASQTLMPNRWTIATEAVKVWANALRAQVFTISAFLGLNETQRNLIIH